MNTSRKPVSLSVGVALLAGILAFGRSGAETPESRSPENKVAIPPISIDAFSDTPPGITGLSCKFSKDAAGFKAGKYIYMNDCGKTAYMKINGVLTKFTNPEFRQYDEITSLAKSKSDQYEMILRVKTGPGTEKAPKAGVISVTDKKGRTVETPYYGECGC